jgi:hypothetical protein
VLGRARARARALASRERSENTMAGDLRIHSMRRDWCLAETRGMVLGVFATMMRSETLREIREVVNSTQARQRRNVTTLSIYQFGLLASSDMSDDTVRREILETLRVLDNKVVASASVLQTSDFVAAAMRSAIAGIQLVVRPKVTLKVFNAVGAALDWIVPLTVETGAVGARGHFVDAVAELKMAHQKHVAT